MDHRSEGTRREYETAMLTVTKTVTFNQVRRRLQPGTPSSGVPKAGHAEELLLFTLFEPLMYTV